MNHFILAQADIGQLQASLIKSLVIIAIVGLVVGSFVVGAIMAVMQYRMEQRAKKAEAEREKESKPREIHPQPLDVVKTRRFNPDLAKSQHDDVTRRLDGHDAELDKLWFSMRQEDEATRKELRDYVADTNLSLGRIEGALGTQPKEKNK